MSNMRISETTHLVMGISPVADAFSGTVVTKPVNMKNYDKSRWVIVCGGGARGTSTFTVEACDNTTPSNTSAVPFHYREATPNSDTAGALTAATASGFTCTAGTGRLITIEVDAEALIASGYQYVRLKAVESVDSPVIGAVLEELCDPKSTGLVGSTVLT